MDSNKLRHSFNDPQINSFDPDKPTDIRRYQNDKCYAYTPFVGHIVPTRVKDSYKMVHIKHFWVKFNIKSDTYTYVEECGVKQPSYKLPYPKKV